LCNRIGNGSGARKSITYNRLQTHDKNDFLSSSNPNLLDIVGKAEQKDGKKDHNLSSPHKSTGPSSSDSNKVGMSCRNDKKPVEGKQHARKFTFKVSDDGGGRNQDHEDSDDSNWIEYDEDEDDNSSEYAEEEEDARRCGYCGCEKKYVVTPK